MIVLRKWFSHLLKNEKGSSELIETLFVLQIILMLIFGFIFFINTVREDLIMDSAARTGAREYGITHDSSMGVAQAEQDLATGRVRGASVYEDGESIIVSKPIEFHVPFAGDFNFGLRKQHEFRHEVETFYYGLDPANQGSQVCPDNYSGYTGNPYAP